MKTKTSITLPLRRPTPPAQVACRTLEEAKAHKVEQAAYETSARQYRDIDLMLAKFRQVEGQVQGMDQSPADFCYDEPGRVVLCEAPTETGDLLDAEMVFNEKSGASYGYIVTRNPQREVSDRFTYLRRDHREELRYTARGEANGNSTLVIDHSKGTLSYDSEFEWIGGWGPPTRYVG